MAHNYSSRMEVLATSLNTILQENGQPPQEFRWRDVSEQAMGALDRMERRTSMPTQEPEAFRGSAS